MYNKKNSLVMLKASIIFTRTNRYPIESSQEPSGCALKDVSDGFVSLFMPEI